MHFIVMLINFICPLQINKYTKSRQQIVFLGQKVLESYQQSNIFCDLVHVYVYSGSHSL